MIQLTPSIIIEYLYCPRFTFYEHLIKIPQNETKNFKVLKGREIHDEKLQQNKDYLRKKIGVNEKWLDVYLSSENLRGRVDEVLLLADGSYAPLDYKFALWKEKVFITYKIQLICYALLIEKKFNGMVTKGYIVYTRSKNHLELVPITVEDKNKFIKTVTNISHILENNYYPKPTKFKSRCVSCTYKNICIK